MKNSISLVAAVAATFLLSSCADDPATATAPSAAFSTLATAKEGKAVAVTNTSADADSYSWMVMPGGMMSTDKSPVFSFDTSGTYEIMLVAKSDGGTDTARQNVTITQDNIWRATSDSSKTWRIVSLKVGGVETVGLPCSLDNTVSFSSGATPTFNLSEGADVCPSAQQAIPPQSGNYEPNPDWSVVTMHITTPFTFDINWNITTLTRHYGVAETTLQAGPAVMILAH
jgi:PKD repeat protein